MILEEIVANARLALAARRERITEAELRQRLTSLQATASLAEALGGSGVSLIAEVKRASPSRGALNMALDAPAQAVRYAQAGVEAISILTEEKYFGGSLADLQAVHASLAREGLRCPLLRKDFIVDEYQLLEARVAGADAVLLIVAALNDQALRALYRYATDLGLSVLVEVHDESELRRALWLEPAIIGINNRDLRDFAVDLTVTEGLLPLVPSGCLVVSESGIRTPADVRRLADLGVDAVLVGEALVTASDPLGMVRALKEAGQ